MSAERPWWRLLELNARLPSARFLAVQVAGEKPRYDPDWRRLEPLAAEEGFDKIPINTIGDRFGRWRQEPLP